MRIHSDPIKKIEFYEGLYLQEPFIEIGNDIFGL